MRAQLVLGSVAVSLSLVAVATLVFDLSFSRAALLAPALVISVGAAAAILLVLGKALLEPWRRSMHR